MLFFKGISAISEFVYSYLCTCVCVCVLKMFSYIHSLHNLNMYIHQDIQYYWGFLLK